MTNNTKKNIFNGITKSVFILGLVSLLNDLSSQMVFPLIPLFMTSILGAGAYAVGIVEGAAETTASLLKVFSGYWSDKIKKRKPFVLFGYSLSAFTKPLFALATVWPMVLVARVVERIGKGIRSAPRDALVAEHTPEKLRGKAFGFQRAMDGIGSVLGAVIAFFLIQFFSYRKIFLIAFIPGLFAIIAIFFIREKNKVSKKETQKLSIKIGFKELPWNLKIFIVAATIFAIGHFGYAFLLLRAKQIGLDDSMSIFMYILFYLSFTIFTIPFGILSDKTGRKPILTFGYLLFALTSISLIFTKSVYSILFVFIVYGIFYAMIDGIQRAFVVDLAPKNLKGTALGTFHTAIGIVALPGGYIAGLLWDKIGSGATFIYGFVLSLVSILVLILFVKSCKTKKEIGCLEHKNNHLA